MVSILAQAASGAGAHILAAGKPGGRSRLDSSRDTWRGLQERGQIYEKVPQGSVPTILQLQEPTAVEQVRRELAVPPKVSCESGR